MKRRSPPDHPPVAMDLSRGSSHLGSTDMGLSRQPGWHNRLTRSHNPTSNRSQNHPGSKPSLTPAHSLPAPAPRLSSYGTRSRSLLSHRSPTSLPGINPYVGEGEAGARPPALGVETELEGGVQGRGLEPGGALNGERHPVSGRMLSRGGALDQFHSELRSEGGELRNPGSYNPDQSDSPSLESSIDEDSQSDSDVIFLVSTTQDDMLVSQEDSTSLCSSLDRDFISPLVDSLSPVAASSLDEAQGCFLLPQPLSSPSPDSTYSDDSSYSTGEMLVHAKPVLHLSQLAAVYSDCPGSPLDISSDDSDVIEVPVTNQRGRTDTPPPCVYEKRTLEAVEGKAAAQEKSLSPQPGAPQSWGVRRSPRASESWGVRRSPRTPKSTSSPVHTPGRTVYSRGAKSHSRSLSLILHSESYDSGDMMDSSERQSSSEEGEALAAESEDSDVVRRMVRKVPSDRLSPSAPEPTQRDLSPGTQALSQSGLPASSLEAGCKTETQPQPPTSSSGGRKRLTKRKPRQRAPPAKQPAKPPPASREAAAGKTKTPAVRRRRKKHKPACGGPAFSSLFTPQEPEIQLRYARNREERKENKSENFCPFVHVERRECTVVNYQEEEQGVRGARGQHQVTAGSGSLSGLVPRTSCYKLGRLSSDSRGETSQVCCLCGGPANTMGLGDLHGPYYLTGPGLGEQNHSQARSRQLDQNGPAPKHRTQVPVEENGWHGVINGHVAEAVEEEDRVVVVVSDGESSVLPADRTLCPGGSGAASPGPRPEPPLSPGERWVHEDCGIWSVGVFLVKGKLYGLEEAVRLARETVCTSCHRPGATMGCLLKGCPAKYHYRCASQSECALNEDNFSMRCPKHKNKPFQGVTRQCYR